MALADTQEIVTLPKGKPVFSDKNLPSFSISYAGNMVGVALTTEGECGLDMELQRATRGFHSPHAPDNRTPFQAMNRYGSVNKTILTKRQRSSSRCAEACST